MDGWMDGWTDRQMDVWTDGWVDWWTHKQLTIIITILLLYSTLINICTVRERDD